MAEIQWIKLSVNMFNDEKIKLIRTMPEGDSITMIWIQMLCLAGKINDGGSIYMGQNLAYSDEMLATILNHPINVMRSALNVLKQFEMIEIGNDGLIDITNWEKHQNIDGMDLIKKQGRERKRKYDLRKKLKEIGVNVDSSAVPSTLLELEEYTENKLKEIGNVTVTSRNGLEKIREEKNREDKDKNIMSSSNEHDHIAYQEIIDYLNQKANKSYRHSTKKTKDLIKARVNDGFELDDFKKVIDNKCADWSKSPKWNKFLRPETLFGTKFESYLNEEVKGANDLYYGSESSSDNERPF